jgi:hypothetical protein
MPAKYNEPEHESVNKNFPLPIPTPFWFCRMNRLTRLLFVGRIHWAEAEATPGRNRLMTD